MPSASDASFATPSAISVEPMFQATQCTNVPFGASGASTMSAYDFTAPGAPLHESGGDTSSPSHVKRDGIEPSFANAELFTESTETLASFCMASSRLAAHASAMKHASRSPWKRVGVLT